MDYYHELSDLEKGLWKQMFPSRQKNKIKSIMETSPIPSANLKDALCILFPILPKILNRQAGSFVGVLWTRQLKTLKENKHLIITKETRATVRTGINYDNRESVQAARESGELPSENNGLPWGSWELFPYVIGHKGEHYIRLYPVENRIPKIIYRINGKLASKEQVMPLCLASEFKEHENCFTIKINNLRRVLAKK